MSFHFTPDFEIHQFYWLELLAVHIYVSEILLIKTELLNLIFKLKNNLTVNKIKII